MVVERLKRDKMKIERYIRRRCRIFIFIIFYLKDKAKSYAGALKEDKSLGQNAGRAGGPKRRNYRSEFTNST